MATLIRHLLNRSNFTLVITSLVKTIYWQCFCRIDYYLYWIATSELDIVLLCCEIKRCRIFSGNLINQVHKQMRILLRSFHSVWVKDPHQRIYNNRDFCYWLFNIYYLFMFEDRCFDNIKVDGQKVGRERKIHLHILKRKTRTLYGCLLTLNDIGQL